jgi:predicted dehydrogenase
MSKIRLGIIGTADIAFRRFLPALIKNDSFEYVGVASRDIEKTKKFINAYGGIGYNSYEEIVNDGSIDALYIPLPPALHYKWAYNALISGKHVLLEKPFTTNLMDTNELVKLAQKKNVAIHENYMFEYHSQLKYAKKIINDEILGKLRLIRIVFSFPMRSEGDFRYNKELGGGSLLDCGGYTVKLASILLGDGAKVICSKLNYDNRKNIDLYGTATLTNDHGLTSQISFGMDNTYKCELELLGSKGSAVFNRIFTSPNDFNPTVNINIDGKGDLIELSNDDQFYNSIEMFYTSIIKDEISAYNRDKIVQQAKLIESIRRAL